MKNISRDFIILILAPLITACSLLSPQSGFFAPAQPATAIPPTPFVAACPSAMAVVKTLYDSDEAGRLDASLELLTDDISLTYWAQGLNGHHMSSKALSGKDQIRSMLDQPGFRWTNGKQDGPVFQMSEFQTSGDSLTFMLRPDRIRPDGRPYNPYQVKITFAGCKIKQLNVIEFVTWA